MVFTASAESVFAAHFEHVAQHRRVGEASRCRSTARRRFFAEARLAAAIRQKNGKPVNPDDQADEELKLIAIHSLMQTDSDKALPMLQKLLESSQPPKIKEQALFVRDVK